MVVKGIENCQNYLPYMQLFNSNIWHHEICVFFLQQFERIVIMFGFYFVAIAERR